MRRSWQSCVGWVYERKKEMNSRTGQTVCVVGAMAFVCHTAHADVIVYDPFEINGGPGAYLVGNEDSGVNVIGGQNPVTGPNPAFYAGGWIQSGGDSQAVRDLGSLSYPLFPSAGARMQETLQFSCCTFGRSGREIAGGLGGVGVTRTIYQSFLIDFGTSGVDDPTQFGFHGYETWNGGIGDSFKAVDLFVNHFSGVTDLTLSVTTPSGTQMQTLAGNLDLEELAGTHLVVMKFEFNPFAPDRVSVFLDPTDSVEGNWAPAASIAVNTSDLVITHHGLLTQFQFSGSGHIPGGFDELRWGDTFADVTPFIPAPGAAALLGIGALGLMSRRRRS
jgi:hypothetical protein